MKIAIINLTGGGICGGYRQYLRRVIPLIARNTDVDALLCAAPDSWRIQEWFDPIKNVKFVECPTFKLFCQNDRQLRGQLDSFCPDVLFVPVERYFKYKNVPVVNMLQNMEPAIAQSSLYLTIKSKVQDHIGRIAMANSDSVIAISNFVRDFLISKWHVSPDKIALIYHGIQQDQKRHILKPQVIPQSFSRNFIFTAGSIRPVRGLEDLILAAKTINFDSWNIKAIVVAGETIPSMLRYKQGLLKLIKENNLVSRFIFLDGIDTSQMEWCYENCRIFIMTSRVESFGMIGLEAMADGCLCIVADNPCLPEIFGGCALYYKPKDAAGLAHVINLILSWRDEKKVEMSRKAQQRASEFSWDNTVDALIKEFKKAIEANRRR